MTQKQGCLDILSEPFNQRGGARGAGSAPPSASRVSQPMLTCKSLSGRH